MAEYIEFETPSGFEPPEGTEEGKDFDMVATFRVKPDGKSCLVAVGGLPVGEPQATESEEEEVEDEDDGSLGARLTRAARKDRPYGGMLPPEF